MSQFCSLIRSSATYMLFLVHPPLSYYYSGTPTLVISTMPSMLVVPMDAIEPSPKNLNGAGVTSSGSTSTSE
jgi:glycerol dehydrogenase-like iron-containing ADH family enzyme